MRQGELEFVDLVKGWEAGDGVMASLMEGDEATTGDGRLVDGFPDREQVMAGGEAEF